MGEIAILHAEDSRQFSCRLGAELAAEGHSVLRREAGAPMAAAAFDPASKADAVVLVWSPEILRNATMIDAARRALARRALAPVRIGGVEPPASFAHLWPIDLDGWSGDTGDPRWQFVRDEIALAMRRSEVALTTAQIARPSPRRRVQLPALRPRPSPEAPAKFPVRMIAPGAASLAIVASLAVILTAQRSGLNAASTPPAAPPLVAYVAPLRPTEPVAAARQADREIRFEAPAAPMLASLETSRAESAVASQGGADIAPAATVDPTAASSAPPDPLDEKAAAPPARSPDEFKGVVFRDCLDCPDMSEIPASITAAGEAAVRPFALSRREITFDQWRACVADGGCRAYSPPDAGWGRGDRPAIHISFEDALAYVDWLSKRTGRLYRLPKDAEWTFAALSGGRGAFAKTFAPSPDRANYADGPWKATLPAGSFDSSAYGLFDMHGNVWEWTADCATEGGEACATRIVKGGAYDAPVERLAATYRFALGEKIRAANTGFRVARETP